MTTEVLYPSFEQFVAARMDSSSINVVTCQDSFRSHVTKERAKVERMCVALGIPLEVFKPARTYQMTRGCCELFDRLLCWYESDYGRAIRKKHFTQIPEAFLVEVRGLLFDALRDADLPPSRIVEEICLFEYRTGCPKRIIPKPLSEPVAEAIQICRKKLSASDSEWDLLGDCLELQYLSKFRPVLIDALIQEASQYIDAKKTVDQAFERIQAKHTTE